MALSKEELKKIAIESIEKNKDKIIQIGDSVFAEPELGFKEFKTAKKVKELFSDLNINYRDEVAITGVIGELKGKENKTKIAFMAEMDAIVSPLHPHADKSTGAAHACGHNCMIATLAGVAYAFAQTGIMNELSGDLSLMAVPAEEFVELEYRKRLKKENKLYFMGGKQEFIRLGEMDDIDIMVMQHNGLNEGENKVATAGYGSNGFVGKMVQYIGKASHSGAEPHLGINALNAANIGLTAVSFQRETFQDKDNIRVHPIITKGGDLVNVVPDDVRIETYIRGSNINAILDADFKVTRAFKAGGDAVGAQTIFTEIPGYLPLKMHYPLMEVMHENLKIIFGESHVFFESAPMSASTDAGDVSNIIPTLHAGFGGIEGALHSTDMCLVDKNLAYIDSSKALALTIIDLLYDDANIAQKITSSFIPTMTKEEYLKNWGKL